MRYALAALLSLLALGPAGAQVAIPPLRAPVTDLTGTLTAEQAASIERNLRAFEERKGSQVAVLILPTTAPETIEQYSLRVAEAWKIGRKDTNDGVILVVAKNDRTMRIEVGYGLEGALPDAIAKRIIRDDITPHFRTGEFYLGVVAGIDRITRVIDGEPLPQPSVVERARRPSSDIGSIIPILLIGGFVVSSILRSIFGRFGGASIAGIGAGLIVWFVVGTLVVAILGAIVAFVITLFSGGGGSGWSGGRRRGGLGGLGGWGGGGFGGGGFGGGGWGGGGGGFGGGGASGRW